MYVVATYLERILVKLQTPNIKLQKANNNNINNNNTQ